jgi:uncharacterized protein
MTRGERVLALTCMAGLATGLLCFAYGVLVEADWLEVTRTVVETAKLPRGKRLRIVHLSDLHVDRRSRTLAKLPEVVRAEHPDLVVFTGDAINTEEGAAIFRETLGQLEAASGRFSVKGNHDVWYWNHLDLFGGNVATELKDDAPVLVADGDVALCGAPYGATGNLDACLRAAAPRFAVVAYHTPDLVEGFEPLGPDLYLAGHTHGGQVRAPFYGALVTMSKFDKKYEMGRYQVGPTILYVNRGIGFESSAPRVRFACRPEVAVIDIVGTGENENRMLLF